jgi:branched-chain amino acid transport system permease protein
MRKGGAAAPPPRATHAVPPVLTLQVVLSGVLLGGLYACMAIGFSIIWGVTNLINLAHGSMIIIGAYVTWGLWSQFGIDPFLLVPVAAAALFVFGFLLYRVLLHRVATASLFMTLILTFGLDRVLVNINLHLFSADVRAITLPYADRVLEIGEIRLPYIRIAVFGMALLLTLLLHLFMNHTRVGQSIRATAQNVRAASVLGIDTRRVYAITFGLGAAMAGAAGSLIAMVYSFTPVTGDSLTMKAFVIVVLGGLGSMHGAIIAGIVLAVAENIVSGLIAPGYRDAVSFILLLAILLVRPRGLFGSRYLADAKI